MSSQHKDHRGAALREVEEHFAHLVGGVQDYAIFLLDPNGIVKTWNCGAERIKGYAADEIIGKHFSVFYPPDATASGWPQHELDTARRVGRFEDEGWRVRKDGGQFWTNVIITSIYDDDQELAGFLKITRDLTERRNAFEKLRQSEMRFRLLVDQVKDYAIFMLDVGGHVVSWNTGAARIKGYAADEIIGKHFPSFTFLRTWLPTSRAGNLRLRRNKEASKTKDGVSRRIVPCFGRML